MAGRSARVRRVSDESDSLMRTPERQRRSLSQGDDTPRPSGMLAITPQTHEGSTATTSSSSIFHSNAEQGPPAKRLAFLGDLLSATSGSAASSLRASSNQLHTARSHSRADSANLLRESAASPTPGMSSSSSHAKGHPSPSKIVSREMHRLGSLAHLPGLNPSLSAPSTVPLTVSAQPGSMSTSGAAGDNPWPALHVHILPLFNGEPLRIPIEDLNTLVRRHIQTVVSSAPPKALNMLENDVGELIANGMVTLGAKLTGMDEEKLVSRVVEIWGFFWDQVLPYVEGALLPLQTEPLLLSLYRIPKGHKPSSPAGIDVRTIALQSFRDQFIYPAYPALHERLMRMREQSYSSPGATYQQPRLQQMLLVLISQRSLPTIYSLTAPPPPPPPGEEAVQSLLRTIRTPLLPSPHQQDNVNKRHYFGGTGAPSFLSAGLPRDRRGRIAQKPERRGIFDVLDNEPDADGGETPRIGLGFTYPAREKEREFLESLRSPEPEPENARASMGGWGLGDGLGGEEVKKIDHDEYDDEDVENLGWDGAQAVVERMVGMKI